MKKVKICRVFIALSLIIVLCGCGDKFARINIDSEGYGRTTLPNGTQVLINVDRSTSLTAARILVGGGVLSETAEKNGVTNLMVKMLLKGNESMAADEVTEKLDFLGANVSINCYRDYSAISFVSLTENFSQVMEVICNSLISPTFTEDELTKLKSEVEGDIKASDDSQPQASSKLFWKTAYGEQGYGLPATGTQESMSAITIGDIESHYKKFVVGGNIIFSIATDMPAKQIVGITSRLLGRLKKGAEPVSLPSLELQSDKIGFISNNRNQSFVYYGAVLTHAGPKEVPYLFLLNQVMGGGIGSRLWYLRQKEKLAYAVYTQCLPSKYSTVFRAAIGTDTSKVKTALSSLEREWATLISDGITEEELADAKVGMKNRMIYRIDIKSNRANNMAYYEYIGYNYRYILDLVEMADGITTDQINNFVKEKFTDDRKYVSIVGKQ
jgi:zinc protease